ncbi:LacI family DNA-binding transcriptional regulator [Nocardia sp. NPDC057455]|uniref:LacI family DNA-binding transcriptional regulator n=1 Tax=Nocardia sp. NPDC057455 TaxID=3346138 RepID=UPI00366CCC9A
MEGVRKTTRPTRADVARLANVSTATVSYVLNNVAGQRISLQTQQAVRQAAAALGYRPNLAARNLVIGGSGVVLYIVPRMALGELAMEVGAKLTTALARHGLLMSLQFETDDGANVVEAIASLNPMAVAATFPLAGPALEAVTTAGIPQIHLGSANLHALAALNLTVEQLRVEHLIARGHRQLGFAITNNRKLRPLADYWLAGVRAATRSHDLPDPVVAEIRADGADAARIVSYWVERGVTAICAQSDETAFAVLHGIRRAGLVCPRDLAVMGVDAITLAAMAEPPLTTIGFRATEIVETAVDAMMAALGLPAEGTPHTGDFAVLIPRNST